MAEEKTPATVGDSFAWPWPLPIPLASTPRAIQTRSGTSPVAAGARAGHVRLPTVAHTSRSGDRGHRTLGNRGGPCAPVRPLPFPSHAFRPASGLGAFRYPELIKVFDRFQLEYEFLPETSTILDSPNTTRSVKFTNALYITVFLPAEMCGLGTIPKRSPNRRPHSSVL